MSRHLGMSPGSNFRFPRPATDLVEVKVTADGRSDEHLGGLATMTTEAAKEMNFGNLAQSYSYCSSRITQINAPHFEHMKDFNFHKGADRSHSQHKMVNLSSLLYQFGFARQVKMA